MSEVPLYRKRGFAVLGLRVCKHLLVWGGALLAFPRVLLPLALRFVRLLCLRLVFGEREFFIDNLLVRFHFTIVMIRWTGLAPGRFEFSELGLASSERRGSTLDFKDLYLQDKAILWPCLAESGLDCLCAMFARQRLRRWDKGLCECAPPCTLHCTVRAFFTSACYAGLEFSFPPSFGMRVCG